MHGMTTDEELDYWRERAKSAETERDAMRASLVHVAGDLRSSYRDAAREAWAIRETANRTGEPFSHERVQAMYDEYPKEIDQLVEERDQLRAECERLRKENDDLSRKNLEDFYEYKRRRNEQFAAYDELRAKLAGAEAANASPAVIDYAEHVGHLEIVEQCRDYLAHEITDNGDPSGKLQDFVESLRVVLDQLDRCRRRLNWYEAAHEVGTSKLREYAVDRALTDAREAAREYAERVNGLGFAADDNDPAVMKTAGPIGEAQARLYMALGIYDEECERIAEERISSTLTPADGSGT